jgi:transcriptional regulator with XRE-family HTH domain
MPKTRPSSLGITLRFCRLARGWSEEELARAAGVKPIMISRYERGAKKLSRERLEDLVALMDVPPETVGLLLYALDLTAPAESPRSPLDPTPAELAIIQRAALVVGLRVAEAVRARLTANLRREKAARARREAERLWKTLNSLSPARRRAAVETEAQYQTWALAERLCLESERAAAHRADWAVELSGLALRVAELAPGPEIWRSRLQGYAWAFIANARRVQGDLPGAEDAFLHSNRFWDAGSASDPGLLDASRLYDLKASLRRYQGRFEEALALLDQALKTSGTEKVQGRLRINKANTLELLGEFERAIAELRQAERLSEGAQDLRLSLNVRFTLAANLWQLEQYADVEALVPKVRELAVELGNELDLIRVLWLEARVASGLGRIDEAMPALEQVRRYFSVNRIAFDAALASLELATLYLKQSRTAELRQLTDELLWIFKNQAVHQEALAALRLFYEAVKSEDVTAELAKRLADYLVRARHNPKLRFEI